MLHQLAYTSSSTSYDVTAFIDEDLPFIKERNCSIGVSGILLFADGTFLQVLEGEEASVRSLYEKIARDPRHKGVKIVLEREAKRRSFPDWAMGWRHIGADHPLAAEITKFASTDGIVAHSGWVNGKVLDVVDRYFRVNWG